MTADAFTGPFVLRSILFFGRAGHMINELRNHEVFRWENFRSLFVSVGDTGYFAEDCLRI